MILTLKHTVYSRFLILTLHVDYSCHNITIFHNMLLRPKAILKDIIVNIYIETGGRTIASNYFKCCLLCVFWLVLFLREKGPDFSDFLSLSETH